MNTYNLESLGIYNATNVYRNLSVSELIEISLVRQEGKLASNGALVVNTGERTGRSPNDKFIVDTPDIHDKIWWGPVNKPMKPELFEHLYTLATTYLQNRDIFIFDGFAGADKDHRLAIRVVAEKAWHALFSNTLFIRPTQAELAEHVPQFTVINVCGMKAVPKIEGLSSEAFVCVNFQKKIILIGGTQYAGETKKSIFSILNHLLPQKNVFPMHCSANLGENNDSALFFGLSGTGKTTLSADPQRRLIGDDEHGWSDNGIFNFEGGCYAKCINLSYEAEPQIWNAIKFGSVLENVSIAPISKVPDFKSDKITENTRATYPVEHVPNCVIPGVGPHPKNVFFLTCDAFGVLPPIAKLDANMAMYHFLSGYTAKVAGTEAGITEPKATFSTCFGSPFLPLHPTTYAKLLGEKLTKHGANCWLVNTGWSGGPYGTGSRMKISITRALLTAALRGDLEKVKYHKDPIFNFWVPDTCEGVNSSVLVPRNTWKNTEAYDKKAHELASLFVKNFNEYKDFASADVVAAGPCA
ncbi:MAG TPA: phosphoenolpyruvate carboxykinase (ATP) [Candidatus Wallbacteria bacterium]|nr:phosphoenolpyruvate carboxykinase (ATP) [Candidatus Wallbacteria bacterium]